MKRLLLLCGICIVSQIAVSQCKLTVTVSFSGNCAGSLDARLQKAVAEQTAKYYNAMTFNIPEDCERAGIAARNDISGSYGGCTAHVTVSCGGCPRASKAGNINIDVLGVSQGTTFYSTNSANEIRDWSNDYIERMLALNKEYQDMTPSMLTTGDDELDQRLAMLNDNNHDLEDYMIVGGARIPVSVLNKPFVSVNMREDLNKVEMANDFSYLANKENVQKYVDFCRNLSDLFMNLDNPYSGDLTMLLHQKFRDASNYDVDVIMQMLPSQRSDEEKQALIDYQAFRKEVTDKIIAEIDDRIAHLDEVKNFEMAVLAENCYKDSGHTFLSRTNYKEVNTDFFIENTPMRDLSVLIDECNSTNSKTGFHAEIYYNEKTNEYTIAFEGTNTDEVLNDWIKADANLGFGGIPEQYKMANKIAEFINNPNFPTDIKINFTGHSLGGGLASIAGLVTGKPTYTYNAAGVNRNIAVAFGLEYKIERKDYNIKAFQSEKDPLTSVQEGNLKPVVTGAIISGISTVNPVKGVVLATDVFTSKAAAPAIGNKEKVWNDSGHSIIPMVKYLSFTNSIYEGIKQNVYEKGHGVEYQTQESILILKGS